MPSCQEWLSAPKGRLAPLSYAETQEKQPGGKLSVWNVDHRDRRHTNSRLSNLQFIQQKDDPDQMKQPRAPTKKTTTTKASGKKATTTKTSDQATYDRGGPL